MNKRFVVILLTALLLALVGCATKPPKPPSPPPEEIIITEPLPKPVTSKNTAVNVLVEKSRNEAVVGETEAADAALERALRIEPKNPWLWLEFAQLRLAQGQFAQAISMAQKSLSFAGKDKRLQAQNWRVIGNAQAAQGKKVTSEKSIKRAVDLEMK